jgi:hypothetical protein
MVVGRTASARVLCLMGLVSCAPVMARADEERPEATPYRPTVSTPAALSAPGWLEGELGGLGIDDRYGATASAHRASAPWTLKYAFTEDWGVRVGGEAIVGARDDSGLHRTGVGDTSLVGKRRFAVDDDSAFGVEVGGLFPTARPALRLGSGKPDWSVNGIYSIDFAGWHADANLVETRIGARMDAVTRWQGLEAVALSHPIGDRWTAEGELSGTRQHGARSTAQFLGALAYAARRDCVLDFGAARGLNHASPTWQVLAGVTIVLGKVD